MVLGVIRVCVDEYVVEAFLEAEYGRTVSYHIPSSASPSSSDPPARPSADCRRIWIVSDVDRSRASRGRTSSSGSTTRTRSSTRGNPRRSVTEPSRPDRPSPSSDAPRLRMSAFPSRRHLRQSERQGVSDQTIHSSVLRITAQTDRPIPSPLRCSCSSAKEIYTAFWAGREEDREVKEKGYKVGPVGSGPAGGSSKKSSKASPTKSTVSSPRKAKSVSAAPASASKRNTNGTPRSAKKDADDKKDAPVASSSSTTRKRKAALADEDEPKAEMVVDLDSDSDGEPVAPAPKKAKTAAAVASPSRRPVGRPPRKSATPAVGPVESEDEDEDASPAPSKAKKAANPVDKAKAKPHASNGRASVGRASIGSASSNAKSASPAASNGTNSDDESASSSKKKAPASVKGRGRKSKLDQVQTAITPPPDEDEEEAEEDAVEDQDEVGSDAESDDKDASVTNMDAKYLDMDSWEKLMNQVETIQEGTGLDDESLKVFFRLSVLPPHLTLARRSIVGSEG